MPPEGQDNLNTSNNDGQITPQQTRVPEGVDMSNIFRQVPGTSLGVQTTQASEEGGGETVDTQTQQPNQQFTQDGTTPFSSASMVFSNPADRTGDPNVEQTVDAGEISQGANRSMAPESQRDNDFQQTIDSVRQRALDIQQSLQARSGVDRSPQSQPVRETQEQQQILARAYEPATIREQMDDIRRQQGLPDLEKERLNLIENIQGINEAYNQAIQELDDNPSIFGQLEKARINGLRDQQEREVQALNTTLTRVNQQIDSANTMVNQAIEREDQMLRRQQQNIQNNRNELNTYIQSGAISGFSDDQIRQLSSATGYSPQMLAGLRDTARQEQEPASNTELETFSQGDARYSFNPRTGETRLIAGNNTNNQPEQTINLTSEEAIEANEQVASSDSYKGLNASRGIVQSLNNFQDFFDQEGTVTFGGDQQEMEQKYDTLMLDLKNLYDLGVLNGNDYEILSNTIPNPSMSKWNTFNPFTRANRRQAVNSGITSLRERLGASVDDTFTTLFNTYGAYDDNQVGNLKDAKDNYLEFKSGINPEIGDSINQMRDDGLSDNEIIEVLNDDVGFSDTGEGNNNGQSISMNLPQRNNNPGNVKLGGIADQFAAKDQNGNPLTDEQGHLIFNSPQDGFKAIAEDLRAKVSGGSRWVGANPTISELGRVYAEDPNWANGVSQISGYSPDTRTADIPFDELLAAVATQEGYFA